MQVEWKGDWLTTSMQIWHSQLNYFSIALKKGDDTQQFYGVVQSELTFLKLLSNFERNLFTTSFTSTVFEVEYHRFYMLGLKNQLGLEVELNIKQNNTETEF